MSGILKRLSLFLSSGGRPTHLPIPTLGSITFQRVTFVVPIYYVYLPRVKKEREASREGSREGAQREQEGL